jgi:hypothetical protein
MSINISLLKYQLPAHITLCFSSNNCIYDAVYVAISRSIRSLVYDMKYFMSVKTDSVKLIQSFPHDTSLRTIRLWDVEDPTFSWQLDHTWRWDCQPYTPAALYSPGGFGVLISFSCWVRPSDIISVERLGSLKESNDLVGNRNWDLRYHSASDLSK